MALWYFPTYYKLVTLKVKKSPLPLNPFITLFPPYALFIIHLRFMWCDLPFPHWPFFGNNLCAKAKNKLIQSKAFGSRSRPKKYFMNVQRWRLVIMYIMQCYVGRFKEIHRELIQNNAISKGMFFVPSGSHTHKHYNDLRLP